jgi:hypothetical protein
MEINLKNIEELIFFDKKIQDLLPEFRHYFDQWQLGQRIPGMKTLGQRSVFELLNSLNETQIKKLEEYFSEEILVDKINHRLTDCYSWQTDEPNELCKFTGYKDFCIHKSKDKIQATFWR